MPVKAYDDAKGFVFSLNGRGATLVNVTNWEFRAEIESGFLRFVLLTNLNQWRVTDLSGNQYFFGQTTNSRMSNAKSGWFSNAWSGTFRWALSRVETVLGDTTDYAYTNLAGALYPLKISYNGHTNGLTNSHTADFILGTRTDLKLSYSSGYRVFMDRRLEAVAHKAGGQIVWSNRLAYVSSPSTWRSLLQSVTRYGTNLTVTLPPATFGYSTQVFGFNALTYWTNLSIPTGGNPTYYEVSKRSTDGKRQFLDLQDMDGDGRPDRVFQPNQQPFTNLWVQRNNGSGFDNPLPFGSLSVQDYSDSNGPLTTSNEINWTAINAPYQHLLDINGDSLPDRVADPLESLSSAAGSPSLYPYTKLMVQLNGSTNWSSVSNVSWTNVVFTNSVAGDLANSSARAIENGDYILMSDMNGDGLPDRVMARAYGSPAGSGPFTNYWVQFNTGAGFTEKRAFGPLSYDAPPAGAYGVYGRTLNSASLRLLDLNGDGLPDRVMYPINAQTGGPEPVCGSITNYVVEFNNGHGFEQAVYWTGLFGAYTNCVAAHCPESASVSSGNSIQDHAERVLRDINGDGLPDRVFRNWYCNGGASDVANYWLVQFNLGASFSPTAWAWYGSNSSQGLISDADYTAIEGEHCRLMDFNGDGIPDRVSSVFPLGTSTRYAVELSKGPFPDLLINITNGIGGIVSATYKPSTQYDNRASTNTLARQLLPFPIQTVAAVSASDGFYPAQTTTYGYEGGFWNSARREFNGFARVRVRDPLGLTNIHWFHQSGGRDHSAFGEIQDGASDLAKKGMAFRTETICTNGALHQLTLNKVENVGLGNGRHFAFVSQTLTLDYPGNTNAYRATAEQFAHDLTTGLFTNTATLGEVASINMAAQSFTDLVGDEVYQFTEFAALTNPDIRDKPQRTVVTDDDDGTVILRESLYDYDGNTGNLTRQRDRFCEGGYLTNQFAYDTYGNQSIVTNEAGIVTQITYDSTYRTFPVQTVTATFTNTTLFDPRSGQPLSSTDAKGLVTSNRYDAFLRLAETAVSTVPNGAATQWLARYDYRLGMNNGFSTNSVRVRKADDVDATNGHETWSYSDGLGRPLQTRVESETNNVFRISDVVYDPRGNVRFETLPYFSSGTNFTKPSGTLLGTLRTYDALSRLTNLTAAVNGTFSSGLLTSTNATNGDTGSPVGPLTLAYAEGNNPWAVIITDEENKVRKYRLDAFGRTNQIVEVTGGGDYTSTLRHDKLGSLTNLVDHDGNTIEYAYNDLGQMVATADPNLGVWEYRRDFAGRVREQEDAKGQITRFNYDDPLGRLRSRQVYDHTGAFAYGVTNVYDVSGDANFSVFKGQLYQTVDAEGFQKAGYDVRGRVLKNARYLTKNGQTYTNQFTYDNADRVRLTVYPNGGPTLTNVFDAGGNLAQVRQVGGTNTVFYAARGFNALGQLIGINFGNATVTTNDYFPNSKRLRRVVTYKTGSTNLQNLSYTYDKASNLKSLSDGVYTAAASAALTNLVYDDLHRLTSLTRPAISQTTAFSHTSIGNLAANGEAGAGTYNYGTRLPHAVKSANGVNYTYDANGNLFSRGSQYLLHDPENRLVQMSSGTGVSPVSFGYSAAGARLWKQGTNTLQVWIGAHYEEKQGKTLFHVLGGDRLVCTFDKFETNVFEYYHSDHLRSTSILTDRGGQRIQHHEYSAFGRDRFTESSTGFPLSRRYTGQVLDEDTGLYYYNARYYDPQLARFIQPDSIIPDLGNPQSYNRYSYVLNNPLRYTDPNGHQARPAQNQIRGVSANPVINQQIAAEMREAQARGASVTRPQAEANSQRREAQIARNTRERNERYLPNPPYTGKEPILRGLTPRPQPVQAKGGPNPPSSQSNVNSPNATLSGSLNPATAAAARAGSKAHADQPGRLPDQLRSMYPETEFTFTPPGKRGQDVRVAEGMHPSAYPYGNWPAGVNRADFKPDSPGGFRTFTSDQQNKWTEPTHMLRYDPATVRLRE